MLKNETKSEILRAALDDITCVLDSKVDRTANDVADFEVKAPKSFYEVVTSSDVPQAINDEAFYEEANMAIKEPTVQPVVVNQVSIVDMPIETLPCPSELSQNREDSLMLSSKDESYWQPGSSCNVLSSLKLILGLVLMCVVL